MGKPSSEASKVLRTHFIARKMAGFAKYKQSKQYEFRLSFKVSLFIQSTQS